MLKLETTTSINSVNPLEGLDKRKSIKHWYSILHRNCTIKSTLNKRTNKEIQTIDQKVNHETQTEISITKEISNLIDFNDDIQKIKYEYENKLNHLHLENLSLKTKLEEQLLINKTIRTVFSIEVGKMDLLMRNIDDYLYITKAYSDSLNLSRK